MKKSPETCAWVKIFTQRDISHCSALLEQEARIKKPRPLGAVVCTDRPVVDGGVLPVLRLFG
ncbi:MAG: hypothetical protein MUD15_10090, partial [Desulfobacterota bacterium]|nr:hypothetical protein [Thermodesulfobacteriota bacterium]